MRACLDKGGLVRVLRLEGDKEKPVIEEVDITSDRLRVGYRELTRAEVRELIGRMQCWLETGRLELE